MSASLDDLFQEAKSAYRAAKRSGKIPAPSAEPGERYRNPDNWIRTRGVALIHAETESLLGNFSEYKHRTEPECRKLVRELHPIAVSATERVSGSWWIAAERAPEPRQSWHEKRPAILHLHLDRLKIHSPACEVVAHISYGGLARVELALDTTFAQEDGKAEQLVFFPQGTDVLREMSLDSKIALRAELGAL